MSEKMLSEKVFEAMPYGAWIGTNDVADGMGVARSSVSSAMGTLRKRRMIRSRKIDSGPQYEHKKVRKQFVPAKRTQPQVSAVPVHRKSQPVVQIDSTPLSDITELLKSAAKMQKEVVALREFAEEVLAALDKLTAATK